MSYKNHILVLGAGRYQSAIIRKAEQMGFKTIAVDRDPQAVGFRYATEKIVMSVADSAGIHTALIRDDFCHKIGGVVTQAARDSIVTTAELAYRMNLGGLIPGAAMFFNNKLTAAKIFNGENSLQYHRNTETIEPDQLTYPVILKEDNTSGSSGIYKFCSIGDLENYIENVVPKPVTLEKYVVGRHIGIIGICKGPELKIYGFAERILNHNMTTDLLIFPASLSTDEERKLRDYASFVLEKGNFSFGPFQLEVILQKDGDIYYVELEASALGSYLSEYMIPLAGANDLLEDYLSLTMEDTWNPEIHSNRFTVAQKFFYVCKTGYLKNIVFRNYDRDLIFKPYYAVNDKIDSKRTAFYQVLAVGKNEREAIDKLNGVNIAAELTDA